MDIATLNTKLAVATAAADNAKAKIVADEAKIADDAAVIAVLQANQADPAALQGIADGLDAITAKLS
jgi:hypothetical protein